MPEKISPPDLKQTNALVTELFEQVKKWEGTLAGGRELGVNAAAINDLLQTRVSFGDPRHNLTSLTEALFEVLDVQLTPIRQQQIKSQYDFYYMTLVVNMQPRPGTKFDGLYCKLEFGPKGDNAPIVETIFPESKWRTVMNWGGGMSLALDGGLEWNVGVDASKASEIANLPGNIKAKVDNKNNLKAFIAVSDYSYEIGRFDIGAFGPGSSECYWRIQEPDLQKLLSVQFAIVFKVPKGTESITLYGIAWTEPNMNWLGDHARNVFDNLGAELQELVKPKNKASDKFARGAAEVWTLSLPK